MEFSWTSFILELINFLVLVWILKYFFYSPIQQAITKRQQTIQNTLNDAKNQYDSARELQQHYEDRLQIWEHEKEEQRKIMEQSLLTWKTKQQTQFKKNLAKEKEKIEAQQMQTISSLISKNAKEALLNASEFSAKLLSTFADSDLEKKCVTYTINELSNLSKEQIALLQRAFKEDKSVHITSAYSLDEDQKNHLIEILQQVLKNQITALFAQESDLLAGLEIKIGNLYLKANLRDELAFFAEIKNE